MGTKILKKFIFLRCSCSTFSLRRKKSWRLKFPSVLVILIALVFVSLLSNSVTFLYDGCEGETCDSSRFLGIKKELQQLNNSLTSYQTNLERHGDRQHGNLVSAFGQSFQTWSNLSAPGTYRGCVNFVDSLGESFTMVQREDNQNMTIVRCLTECNKKINTYAGLLGGTQCYCTNFTGPTQYVAVSQCCVPCSGDPSYNCGGRNNTFSLYRTKVLDSRCSEISLKREGSMPLIALASFPRSGNTWTRRLLEHATGIYTGSVYWKSESQLVGAKVFLGGNVPYTGGSTLCIKTHLFTKQRVMEFHHGAILLVRNPYKAIVAEAFRRYMISKEEGPERTLRFIKSKNWTTFVQQCAGRWLATAVNWCQNSKRLLVVYYEDLQKNTSKELRRMITFLKQPIDSTRIACAVQEQPSSESTGVSLGNHGIKPRSYLTFDPFTKRMRRQLDGHIATVNATFIHYGHAPLPNYKEATLLF